MNKKHKRKLDIFYYRCLIIHKQGKGTNDIFSILDSQRHADHQIFEKILKGEPIQGAAEISTLDVAKTLISLGPGINGSAVTFYGRTVLQATCIQEVANIELIECLLENGTDVNAKAGIESGLTML